MKLRAFRTRSLRLRFAWLALLALLFQQIALAAYACPVSETPLEPRMVMAGCEGMEMPDPQVPALCDQHCLRDHVTSQDLKAPQVPSLGLPPVHFALTAALLPPVEAQYYEDVPTCRSDPPPAQRFCSLQI
ncbi:MULTISPECIES: hypothetical protein [Gammaproteobacteria]|jgi:hypothetical protein|uniref:Uncharacterized protein n=2 Tax=Stenotrophomonas TaxID=40323 RepID=A0A7W3IGI7_9GAMM|nr:MULTISPECIES: hypothetical protein [Gammaproteobacteria]MBA8681023.1 hypothetical protein [Stenotrophomonas tumulicola]MCT4520767.1 hypothetical protein [Pseudomonas aeruginosa]WIA62965.1 hypothetical protein POS15_07055 [Stenotrophomonas sp. BIO128-Bstrain]